MSHVRTNIVANVTGAAWSAIAQIVCIPIYLRIMGPEAFGLVGFYATLLMSLQIFDLGLSPTMNRELARCTARADLLDRARDFVRTIESGYWLIGVVAAIVICTSAGWISTTWVHANTLPQSTVRDALVIMGCVVALQWPLSLYQGGLIGLQRQVRLNVIKVIAVTASTAGSVLVLTLVSPTITAFFLWQMLVSACHVGAVVLALWLALPKGTRAARFDFQLLRDVMPFALGMAGVALFGLVLTQIDKVLLSKLLSLEDFGYYVLAGTVAGALQLFIAPIYTAIFPKLTALVTVGDGDGVRRLYHVGAQAMAFALAPMLVVLCGFSTEIIRIWTGNETAAVSAGAIAPLLVLGTALNGVLHLPHALRLAHGWTQLDLVIGFVMIILFVPLIVFSAKRFGGVGTAGAWAMLNIAALFITVPLTHRRLLPGNTPRWIFIDTIAPWAAASGSVLLVWFFLGGQLQKFPAASVLMLGFLALLAAGLTLPDIRNRILQIFVRSSPAQI